jgi:type IV pilus assembly protein PilW
MSRRHLPAPSQRGHTLPELLIGMALSSLVIAAATAVYGTSKQTWSAMTAADAVHANARMAFRNIREQVQVSGAAYLKTASDIDGRISVEVSSREEAGQASLSGINGTKYVESVTLGHWHALDAIDCQGNTGGTQPTVRNDYKLNTNKELSCKDLNLNNSTYQALAEGVEDFQLRYAEVNPNTQTIQWKTADQVTAMSQALAIEVCLRVMSINTVNNTKPNSSSKGCQGEAPVADGRLRRTFKRVIAMRNRDGVMP